jgi:hypothetical protein
MPTLGCGSKSTLRGDVTLVSRLSLHPISGEVGWKGSYIMCAQELSSARQWDYLSNGVSEEVGLDVKGSLRVAESDLVVGGWNLFLSADARR